MECPAFCFVSNIEELTMGTGAEMIFRVNALPNGVTIESLRDDLANATEILLDQGRVFRSDGPIVTIDPEELLECYLSEFTPPDEAYIPAGLWLDVNLSQH